MYLADLLNNTLQSVLDGTVVTSVKPIADSSGQIIKIIVEYTNQTYDVKAGNQK